MGSQRMSVRLERNQGRIIVAGGTLPIPDSTS
jgi:hypothetical protein